ncbi:MAG: hypothetical protein R2712_03695 [Vicinamibacterales bacterium]
MKAIEVGVLGATGVVGQQFVSRLQNHPWFNLTWLAASERSEGKTYKGVAPRRLATPVPDAQAGRVVDACVPGRGPRWSSRPRRVGGRRHRGRLRGGGPHRRQQRAQLPHGIPSCRSSLPEVNAAHLALVASSAPPRRLDGAPSSPIPTVRPIVLALALAPLRAFDIHA